MIFTLYYYFHVLCLLYNLTSWLSIHHIWQCPSHSYCLVLFLDLKITSFNLVHPNNFLSGLPTDSLLLRGYKARRPFLTNATLIFSPRIILLYRPGMCDKKLFPNILQYVYCNYLFSRLISINNLFWSLPQYNNSMQYVAIIGRVNA